MISEKMKELIKGSSIIRAMFEEGKKMALKYGNENVYDFSLGNPCTAPPEKLKTVIKDLFENENSKLLHGYMNNSGFETVRKKTALSLNKRFGTDFSEKNIIMTVGAAGGLNVILKTLLNPGDEVLTFSPYFSEYKHYTENFGGRLIPLPVTEDFRPHADTLRQYITPKTKALIINTPNNPTGVVYSEGDIKAVAKVLSEKSAELESPVFLISDEPYREIVYDGITVPFITKYYKNTVVCYSYSKSFSLPGERIGYLVIPDEADAFDDMIAAAGTATRILGFVNAPSLMQLAVAECLDESSDISLYIKNRNLIYSSLTEMGFTCVKPEGAFYLFIKTPENDEKFAEKAKEFNILLVPGSAFGVPGFVRIAYCTDTSVIERSLPAFKKLSEFYKLI